jgi:hypothetical protein
MALTIGTKPVERHFSLQRPRPLQHDERTSLGAQQKTRNLEAAEHQCFTTL